MAFEPYQMRGYFVPPTNVAAIRSKAQALRAFLGFTDELLPLPHLFDLFSIKGITIDVLEDDEFPLGKIGVEASAVPDQFQIYLSTSTHEKLEHDDPRTRFTLFHEIGHVVLKHSQQSMRFNIEPKRFVDSEWQADQFAAEMTMPLDLITSLQLNKAEQLASKFGVSRPAAEKRIRQLTRMGNI